MKKIFIVIMCATIMTMAGCGSLNHPAPTQVKPVQSWWGTKAEIKTFLDSPEAVSERWFIQSLGQ